MSSDNTASTSTAHKTTDNTQIKCFSFTWNNYQQTENWQSFIESFATEYCQTLFYSEEEAPTTKTKHLQGYFQLIDKKRLNTVNNILEKKIYLQKSKKCRLANFRYCSKTGNCWVYNKNSGFKGLINTKQKQKIEEIDNSRVKIKSKTYQNCIELAKQGKFNTILDLYPHIYLQFENKLKTIFIDINKTQRLFLGNEFGPFFKNHFLWLWGKTGTGKSYFCNTVVELINAFYKELSTKREIPFKPLKVYYKNKNKWWDKYTNEEIVVIEEASPETFKTSAHYYKQWIDEYPFNPEIKGATLDYIRPKFIIITSNYSLKQCCSNDIKLLDYKEEDYEPLNRRLEQIELTENQTVNWPDFRKLALYENSINLVKHNYSKKISETIKEMKFGEIITEGEIYYEEYKLLNNSNNNNTTPTIKRKRGSYNLNFTITTPKKPKNKEKENNNNLITSFLSNSSTTTTTITDNENSDTDSTFPETPTFTVMMWNKTDWNYNKIYCIHCFTRITSGLFCKDCATIKSTKNKLAKCNNCFDYFSCLIDAHCPSCTIYLKKRYKHIFPTNDEDYLSNENDNYYNNNHPWYDSNDTSIKHNKIYKQSNIYYDSFGNIFYSEKHMRFIYKKLIKIQHNVRFINNNLNPLKNPNDQKEIDKLVLEIDNIISDFDLRKYKYWPIKRRWRTTDELSQIANSNKCYACQHNLLNKDYNCFCTNNDIIRFCDEDNDEDLDFDKYQENDYINPY